MKKLMIKKGESIKKYKNDGKPFFETEKGVEVTEALIQYKKLTDGLSLKGRIDLVIRSLGINPEKLSLYNKLVKLTQFVPYVIPNYNLLLLGGKGTFKSTPYKCYSNCPHVISGTPTKAELRGSKNKENSTALLENDILVFEEIADDTTGGTLPFLKETLESRKYKDKDDNEKNTTTSTVFIGNNYMQIDNIKKLEELSVISGGVPKTLTDESFIDRINATIYLDNKFKVKDSFFLDSDYEGLNVNILMESLKNLRETNYEIEVKKGDDPRDQSRILATVKGLCKILYPKNDASSHVIEGLANFGLHLRSIGKEFKTPFPSGSIKFLVEAMELDNIEEFCFSYDRILVKKTESDYFEKIALNEWGIEKNKLELDYFKNNSDISTTIAHINICNSNELIIEQKYYPLYSNTHTFSSTGSLIERKNENYAENAEFNLLLIETIKKNILHPDIIEFPKNKLRPWKELNDGQLLEIIIKTFNIPHRNISLKKSNYSYDDKNTFKLINFSEYLPIIK